MLQLSRSQNVVGNAFTVLKISQNSRENTCVRVSFLFYKAYNFILLKKRLWHRCFPVNFAKFLRTPFLQNNSERLPLKWNKTKCLPFLIAFLFLFDINTALKIGITITWSFTMRYVIATTSLWCWKKTLYNDYTSISMRNLSISRCKSY